MNGVKRYACTAIYGGGVKIIDSQNGHLVMHEDYEALQQQLTATTNSLTNAQEALKSAGIEADTVQAGLMELVSRMKRLGEENAALMKFCKNAAFDADYEAEIGMERGGFTDAINDIKTPATDAYLNAVRADVIVEAASRIAAQAREEDEGPGIVAAVDALEIIEREFRAGNAGKDGSHE